MNRFVILYHELPPDSPRPSHWDLMLEQGNGLLTWALDRPPADGHAVPATRLPDHRVDYLTYEGPVSGNRGNVSRWDHGTYELLGLVRQSAAGPGSAVAGPDSLTGASKTEVHAKLDSGKLDSGESRSGELAQGDLSGLQRLEVRLRGKRLSGRLVLERDAAQGESDRRAAGGSNQRWTCSFEPEAGTQAW